MRKLIIALALAAGCKEQTPAEHCTDVVQAAFTRVEACHAGPTIPHWYIQKLCAESTPNYDQFQWIIDAPDCAAVRARRESLK